MAPAPSSNGMKRAGHPIRSSTSALARLTVPAKTNEALIEANRISSEEFTMGICKESCGATKNTVIFQLGELS